MHLDWQQKRTLDYLAEGGEGLAEKDGGMIAMLGMECVFLNAGQTSGLFREQMIELDSRVGSAIRITEAGRLVSANRARASHG